MNNPSAFPVSDEASRNHVAGVFGGMTLRDYFAAKVLQALAPLERGTYGSDAEAAYKAADAMLVARERKAESEAPQC